MTVLTEAGDGSEPDGGNGPQQPRRLTLPAMGSAGPSLPSFAFRLAAITALELKLVVGGW